MPAFLLRPIWTPRARSSAPNRLTRHYVLALTAIALLSIGAQFWVHHALARQERVINLAGHRYESVFY